MTNRFSIDRLSLLWNFYWPAIKLQGAIAGGATVLAYLLSLWGVSLIGMTPLSDDYEPGIGLILYSFGSNLLYWCLFAGVLMFGMCRVRRDAIMLPASWQEKSVFYLGYILILYPLYILAIWYALSGLASLFTPCAFTSRAIYTWLSEAPASVHAYVRLALPFNIVMTIFIISCGAFAMAYAKRSRVAMAVVGVLAGMAMNVVIGIVVGILVIVKSNEFANLTTQPQNFSPEVFVDEVVANMPWVGGVACAVTAVASMVLCVLVVLKIKNRQN